MNELIFESFPKLNTQRLFLRQITQEDEKSLFEVLSNEVTCEYLAHNAVNDIAYIKRLINGMQRFFDEKQRIRWGIAQKQDDSLIGHCGFFDIDKSNCCAEISYCLKNELWGQGIMTEAVDAMLKFGFEDYGFNRIVAKVMKGNVGSMKVLQKLGFVQEGLLRESLYKNGQYHDLKIQLKDDRIASLREQVKKLEDDKRKLIVQLVDYEELKSENERLKKQLVKK